jgi:hypothetical protein
VSPNCVNLGVPLQVRSIQDSVDNGKRMFVRVDPNHLSAFNAFIDPYHITATDLRVRYRHRRPLVEIVLPEEVQSTGFPELFEGVRVLSIQQPNLLKYGGDAASIVDIPLTSDLIVADGETDLVADWSRPTATCLAAYEPKMGDVRVVVSFGGILGDPYTPIAGPMPGISAGDNKVFGRNLLWWVSRPSAVTARPEVVEAFKLYDRIESELAEYCKRVVSRSVPDWFNTLPEGTRIKCIERSADSSFPPSAFLDLVDCVKLIRTHWELFEPDFHRCGWLGGKNKATKWISTLNEIRKTVVHPVRRQFGGVSISTEDLVWLREAAQRTRRLSAAS